jgi:hypothetical protein
LQYRQTSAPQRGVNRYQDFIRIHSPITESQFLPLAELISTPDIP